MRLDPSSDEYRQLFSLYLRRGSVGMTDAEARAISSTSGGTTIIPTTYSNMFMEELGNDEIIGKVTKFNTSTNTFNLTVITPVGSGGFSVQKNPGEAGTLIDATTSQTTVTPPVFELPGTSNTGSTNAALTLKRQSVMVKVSRELLEDSAVQGEAGVERIILRQAAQDIADTVSKQILVGNATDSITAGTTSAVGSDSCHGIFNTCRRYGRAFGTSALTVGGSLDSTAIRSSLQAFIFGFTVPTILPAQYWRRSSLILNGQLGRSGSGAHGLNLCAAATSQQAIALGSKDRYMFGLPWTLADMSVGNTGTSAVSLGNEPMALLCDLSRYMLVTASDGVAVTRLNETYADTDQVAFVVSLRCAGVLADVNAAIALGLTIT